MNKLLLQVLMIVGLLKLQADGWQSRIRYEIRFLLCGFFSYMSFAILKLLGDVFAGKENDVVAYIFDNPPFLVLVLVAVCLGYFGLYLSIIAASLFTSLLPKT